MPPPKKRIPTSIQSPHFRSFFPPYKGQRKHVKFKMAGEILWKRSASTRLLNLYTIKELNNFMNLSQVKLNLTFYNGHITKIMCVYYIVKSQVTF
jgi:hypothetical protein